MVHIIYVRELCLCVCLLHQSICVLLENKSHSIWYPQTIWTTWKHASYSVASGSSGPSTAANSKYAKSKSVESFSHIFEWKRYVLNHFHCEIWIENPNLIPSKNDNNPATDSKLNSSLNCDAQPNMETNAIGNIIPSSASKSPIKDRFVQSPSNQMAANSTIQTIAQPYPGEVSNFGAFHHHHYNHIPGSYGLPYDKFKYPANSRSPTNSPYGSYHQGFYPSNVHHHHHRQMVRPNGYIDLVPR